MLVSVLVLVLLLLLLLLLLLVLVFVLVLVLLVLVLVLLVLVLVRIAPHDELSVVPEALVGTVLRRAAPAEALACVVAISPPGRRGQHGSPAGSSPECHMCGMQPLPRAVPCLLCRAGHYSAASDATRRMRGTRGTPSCMLAQPGCKVCRKHAHTE